MKTRDMILLAALGVGAYYMLSKPKDSALDSLLGGGSAPTASLSSSGLPALGVQGAAAIAPGILDWNPLVNPVGYAANVVGAIQNAVSGVLSPKASGGTAATFQNANPTLLYVNDYVQRATGVSGAYETIGNVLKPTASFSASVGAPTAQKVAEIAGLNTGRGLASMASGGVKLASTQIYHPATITASGNVSSNVPLSSAQIASNMARGIW